MITRTVKKSLKLNGFSEFDSLNFLRGIHKSGAKLCLEIDIDKRVEVFLSVFERSLFNREDETEMKFHVLQDFFRSCAFEETEKFLLLDENCALLHVVGTPSLKKEQLSELVNQVLESKIKSSIFLILEPCSFIGLDSPFMINFSVVVNAKDPEELKRKSQTLVSLVYSVYGGADSSIKTILVERGVKRLVKKLVDGSQIHSTILDAGHASRYFQLPRTYGIEQYRKMNFPIPDKPFNGIPIGGLAEFDIDEIKTVRLDPSRIFENVAVWGSTGTGKTSFLKNFLRGLEKAGISFCVLDWHNEYRDIASVLNGKIGEDVLIFNPLINGFSINPLELPSLNPEVEEIIIWERIENFISLLKQMLVLGEVQENIIRRNLYAIYHVNDEVTIGNLINSLEGMGMGGLISKLNKFTLGIYGWIFNNPKSTLNLNELRRKNVILELGDLPTEVRKFLVGSLLLLWWDNLRMDERIPHVLVLDDFNEYSDFEVVRKMLSEARKYRQGLICSYQGPYQLSKEMSYEVARNTGTKIIFKQEQTWDKYIVRDALGGLTEEQMETLSYLGRGETIVKLPSFGFPIRVNMPLPLKLKGVSDSSLKNMLGSPVKIQSTEDWGLTDLEKEFLILIHKNHGSSITEITKILGIKTSKGYELKARMQKIGFLVEEKIRCGVGSPKKVFKLGKKALEILNLEKEGPPAHYGKEEHVFIKNKIAEVIGNRWHVDIENGCDVRVEGNGKKIAIEVETGKSNDKKQLVYNIERNRGWADKTIIICPNKKTKLEIQGILNNGNEDDIVILTYKQINNLTDFLPKN